MSIYYLKEGHNTNVIKPKHYETLDEAMKEARKITQTKPNCQVTILKVIVAIEYVEKKTGEHTETLFN